MGRVYPHTQEMTRKHLEVPDFYESDVRVEYQHPLRDRIRLSTPSSLAFLGFRDEN